MKFLYGFLCFCAVALVGVQAYLDDFYCGDENCYDVLGITRTAKPKEISRAYRALSKKYHPDVRRNEPDDVKRSQMEDKYILLNKAYQTLNKVENRKEYDDIVADNFRYRVLKRKYYGGGKNIYIHPVAPLIFVLVVGSILQRINRDKMIESEKRRCVAEIVQNKQWLERLNAAIAANGSAAEMAKLKEDNKAGWEQKAFALNPVDMVLQVKPVQTDEIFAVQVMKLPYTLIMFMLSFASDFGKPEKKLKRADKITKTASAYGLSEAQLISRTDKSFMSDGDYLGDLDELLKKKLWNPKNMAKLREEAMQVRLKKVPKHRRKLAREEMERADQEARDNAYRDQFDKSFKKSGLGGE